MPLWVKTSSGWQKAKTLSVKNGSTWTKIKTAYVKVSGGNGGWKRFFPTTGPYAENYPTLTSDSAGNNFPVYVYIGTMPNPSAPAGSGNVYVQNKLYGHVGDWNPNGYTISNFDYIINGFPDGTTDLSGVQLYTSTSSLPVSNSTNIDYPYDKTSTTVPIILLDATYDGQWTAITVTANTTSKDSNGAYIYGTDSSDGGSTGRILTVKHQPVNISASISASSYGTGSTLTMTSTWQPADGYSIDTNRTRYAWYQSSSNSYTTLAQLQSNATALSGSASTYLVQSTDVGYYIYGVATCYNGGSDYFNNGVGVSVVAVTSQKISQGVTQLTAPTLTAQTSAGVTKTTNITAGDKFVFTKGTYSNYSSVTPWLQWGSTLASASGTQSQYVGYDPNSPHTISTSESSNQYYFRVRDIVIGNDGNLYNFFGNSYQVVQPTTPVPTFYNNSSTTAGFLGGINNYTGAESYTYSLISTTSTSTPVFTWGSQYAAGGYYLFTVSNMSPGSTATYRITVTKTGYSSSYADTTGAAATAPDPFTYSLSSASVTPDAPTGVTITDNTNNTFYVSWGQNTGSTNIAYYSVNYRGVVTGASASYAFDGSYYPPGAGPRKTPNIPFSIAGDENAYVTAFGNKTGANLNVSTTNNASSWVVKYNITGSAAGTGTFTDTGVLSMPYNIPVNPGNAVSITSVQAHNNFYDTTGTAGSPTSLTPGIGSNRTDASTTALSYALPAPTNTGSPSVTPSIIYLNGTASTTNGSWTGAASYGYQWRSSSYGGFYNASNTPSTNSTYVISVGDIYNLNGALYCNVIAYSGANQTGNSTTVASNTVSTQIADTPTLSQSGTTWTFSNNSNNVTVYSWCVASTASTSAISYNFLNGSSGTSNTWSATSGNTIYSQGSNSSITVSSTNRYIHVIGFVLSAKSGEGYYASPRAVSAATTVPAYSNPPTYSNPYSNPPTYSNPYSNPPTYSNPYSNPPAYSNPPGCVVGAPCTVSYACGSGTCTGAGGCNGCGGPCYRDGTYNSSCGCSVSGGVYC
jgi:hypothetical protein